MMRCKPILGTFVEIQAETLKCNSLQEHAAIASAFDAIQQVELLMNVHSDSSELSRINAYAHLHAVTVHPWVWQVIALSQDLYHQSDGLFNVGIGHVLARNGMRPVFVNHIGPMGDIADIELLARNQIRSQKPVHLDLGGIAKGFAIDLAVDVLQANGIDRGLVNAGGDLRVFGATAHSIQIRAPSQLHRLIEVGYLTNAAMATSANYFIPSGLDGYPSGHIVKSKEETIQKTSASFSVVASTCTLADALTKVFMLSGDAHHPCIRRYQAQAFQIAL